MGAEDERSTSLAELDLWLNRAIEEGGAGLFETLVHYIRHPAAEIRSTAAYGLGEIHDERAIVPLVDTVESDDDEHVRDEALRALESYRHPRILDCLLREVRRPKRSRPPRQVVARQLRHYADQRAVDALRELLEDTDEFVRSDALESLNSIQSLLDQKHYGESAET